MGAAAAPGPVPGTEALRWTPSDAVLLHPERFAGLPRPPRAGRLSAEWQVHGTPMGWGIGLLVGGSAWLANPPESSDGRPSWPFGVAALLIGLGCVAYWLRQRRRMDPRDAVDLMGLQWILGQPARVDTALWCDQALIAALLAGEAAGHLQIAHVIEDGRSVVRVRARPGHDTAWPSDSLEDRLRPMGADDLASMVHDWLADGSYDPRGRAVRLAQHGLVSRGLAGYSHYDESAHRDGGYSVGDCYDLHEAVEARRADAPIDEALALLARCREQRPELWVALREAIAEGLGRRRLDPVYRQQGNVSIPTYPHVEVPLHALDAAPAEAVAATPAAAAQAPVPGRADTEDRATRAAGPATEQPIAPPWGPGALVWALAAAALAAGWPPSGWPAFVDSQVWVLGLAFAALAAAFEGWQVWRARRATAARAAAEAPGPELGVHRVQAALALKRWHGLALVGIVCGTVAVLVCRWLDDLWVLLGLAALVGAQWVVYQVRRGVQPQEVARAVTERLAALQRPRRGAQGDRSVWSPAAAAQAPTADGRAPLPVQLTEGDALPNPDPELLDRLQRPLARRRGLYRLHWWATAALVGGAVMVLGAWAAAAALLGVRPLPELPVAALAMGFAVFAVMPAGAGLAWKMLPFDPEGAVSPAMPRWMSHVARVGLLALALHLLQRPGLQALGALLAGGVVLQWAWLLAALRRLARRHPLPVPARLTLLRVFGAASFDDFSQLIAPWRGVGLIEYLEGHDTIGQRVDAQDAVAEGRLDELLAKSEDEVRERLAAFDVTPSDDLRFGSLSFQCANDVWQTAVQGMLDRSDAVVMDLTALSPANAGCAWELGQLLDRVPLSRVTLLVNDNTDLDCLHGILAGCAARISASSPNLADAQAQWRVLRIGGYAKRQGDESYFQWRRRLSRRLDALLLSAHLLASAQPLRSGLPPPPRSPWWRGSWDRLSPVTTALVLLLALTAARLAA